MKRKFEEEIKMKMLARKRWSFNFFCTGIPAGLGNSQLGQSTINYISIANHEWVKYWGQEIFHYNQYLHRLTLYRPIFHPAYPSFVRSWQNKPHPQTNTIIIASTSLPNKKRSKSSYSQQWTTNPNTVSIPQHPGKPSLKYPHRSHRINKWDFDGSGLEELKWSAITTTCSHSTNLEDQGRSWWGLGWEG